MSVMSQQPASPALPGTKRRREPTVSGWVQLGPRHTEPDSGCCSQDLDLSSLVALAMLEPPCVRINPAPFRPQPISCNMDESAIRFELERQACQSLRKVLQLKLQQRRTRDELVSQGIMPPLKSSAALHEQRRSLERARTEDYLKRKIKSCPERSELIRMHILEDTAAEQLLQTKQLQLKRARLAEDLNDKIAHRPGPMELIHKNIIPVHSSIKQVIIETQFPKASGENSSCDEHSNDSLSPGQPVSQDCPLGSGPACSPTGKQAESIIPSPTQVSSSTLSFPPISGSAASLKLPDGTVASSVQSLGGNTHIKPKPNPDRLSQRHKKSRDNKPKIKKLKYHQYIPPDQKGDKEPPPHLDSSYTKILQQQQLFLQLQILSQHYPTILPAPPKDQKTSSFSSSNTTSSPTSPVAAPPTVLSSQCSHICLSSAPVGGTKAVPLHPNLDGMKVAELKSELKLRSLPVSGTKNNLIERLRTYQELSQGASTTSSPAAGGVTGPGPEVARKSPKAASTTTTNTSTAQEQQFQTSSLNGDAGRCFSPAAAAPQQLVICGGNINPLTPRSSSPAAASPKDPGLHGNPSEELMSSPLPGLSLQPSSVAHLPANIKEEPPCRTTAPCQFSLKSASIQKPRVTSSAAATTTPAAPPLTIDKDRMLREKDKQIAELIRMLRQKQQLVEALKMQLENGNREDPEQLVLLRVKEEPADNSGAALSTIRTSLPPQLLSFSCGTDISKITIKQEAVEAEIAGTEASVQISDAGTLGPQPPLVQTQQVQDKMHLQLRPDQPRRKHVSPRQSALQLAQQQALQKVLQKQQMIQSRIQVADAQQKLCQVKQKKPQKLQPEQQDCQKQRTQSQQHRQQPERSLQVKQTIVPKPQNQQPEQKQPQSNQQQQIQIHLKQNQAPHTNLSQQSGSAPSFPLDHLKSDSIPTLISDTNGNHFLISLTNQDNGGQRTDTSEGNATSHITLQRLQSMPARLPGHCSVQVSRADSGTKEQMNVGFLKQLKPKTQDGALQVSVEQPQQELPGCLPAPPSPQVFFKDQGSAHQMRNISSPYSQTMCHGLAALMTPLSPVSEKTTASPPDDKDKENEEEFIDIVLQDRGMSNTIRPASDPSLDHLHPDSSASSPPPPPLHLLLSPPIPPSCITPEPVPSPQSELRAWADTTKDQQQHLSQSSNGRLEDFLESTTGKPLLGVEPGGLLTLIDDLHNQLLCTPSILDHPLSPMDTFDMAGEGQQMLDIADWLDLTMEGEKDEETPTFTPLGPQTPLSVFSAGFLDSSDLHIHWDSCL
ncbi:LOW QUALITY PROTEIN: myocardin-related transcription factor A-like [Xenentodon cancila]